MRVGLGAAQRGILLHEVFALAVHEAGAVGQHAGLPFPGKGHGAGPVLEEFHVLERGSGLVAEQRAFAGGGVAEIRHLEAARVGAENDGSGLDDAGQTAAGVEAGSADHAAGTLDELHYLNVGDAAHAAQGELIVQRVAGVGAALAVGVIQVIAHVLEAALHHGAQIPLFVAGEDVTPAFEIAEAVVGMFENLAHEGLIAEAVVVIDHFVEQVFHLEFRLHDDHVAAAHHAETAPVAGGLVHNEHVPGRGRRAERRPGTGKSAADDKNIRSIDNGCSHIKNLRNCVPA